MPALHAAPSGPPHIVGRAIHLPADRVSAAGPAAWRWMRAATAHAAAHLAFSPAFFDDRRLPPITRALLGLLEDARVEALACRELPGLRRLWASLHTVLPGDGSGFETLMLRLARSLIDPGFDDPHPWVQKGRRLFFVDANVPVLALRSADELRAAASLLGNDIGQLRLGFNARSYAVGPDYRDDSRWMWPAGHGAQVGQAAIQPPPSTTGVVSGPSASQATRSTTERYPEWDRLISRLRHDWCTVVEDRAAAAESVTAVASVSPEVCVADCREERRLARRLREKLQGRNHPLRRAERRASHEGEAMDIDALVRVRLAQRHGGPADVAIYRRAAPARREGRLMVLIDHSASSAGPWARSGNDMLQGACRVATLFAAALQGGGLQVAICGFSSNGRHQVMVRRAKGFEESLGPEIQARLAALRSMHSTRLGAAVRHATRRLAAARSSGALQLLVISDGLPYDTDVHDPQYLVADARQAVLNAGRRGVRVHCIVLDRAGLPVARQIFGSRKARELDVLERLPAVAANLAI